MVDDEGADQVVADDEGYALVMTTTASGADADQLASVLVERRLAACVQLVPMVSHYVWEGQATRATETLLLIKTTAARVADLAAYVDEHHPYDTPELLEIPVTSGLPAYLRWIDESVG
jgi:periplasmic divalent cation tolerance protein